MGLLEAICVSVEKGSVKQPVSSAELRENWGIEGDAHAGEWHRQISLLAGESIGARCCQNSSTACSARIS